VLADPRHTTAIAALYQRPESRAELEKARHDPWSIDFADTFNDDLFLPVTPDPVDGVTKDLIEQFDRCDHPHIRNGEALRSRWRFLHGMYTVCRNNCETSGQGDSDVFSSFAEGMPLVSYMHCVCSNSPSLDFVVRKIPNGGTAEGGLGCDSRADRTACCANRGAVRLQIYRRAKGLVPYIAKTALAKWPRA
jgi:hypothetical protein